LEILWSLFGKATVLAVFLPPEAGADEATNMSFIGSLCSLIVFFFFVSASVPPLRGWVVRVRVPRDSLFIYGFGRSNQGKKNSLVCPIFKKQVCGQLILRSCGAAVYR
jgi:hypothetical protein